MLLWLKTYGKRTFQCDKILLNGRNCPVRDSRLAVLEDRSDINGFPFNRSLQKREQFALLELNTGISIPSRQQKSA